MADLTNRLNTFTKPNTIKVVSDNVFTTTATLDTMRKKQKPIDYGLELRFPVRYAKDTINRQWISGATEINVTNTDTATFVKYNPKTFVFSSMITEDELEQNAGTNQIISVLEDKGKDSKLNMADELSLALFSDGTRSDSGEWAGLKAVVGNGTNAYEQNIGGIDCLVQTWWQSKYTSLGTTISYDAVEDMFGQLIDGTIRPTLITTTQGVWDSLWASATAAQRTTMGQSIANFGYDHLNFRGVPIVVDTYCTAGFMYFLNFDYLWFAPLKGYQNYKWSGWMEPQKQMVQWGYYKMKGALVCDNRRYQGKIVNITT